MKFRDSVNSTYPASSCFTSSEIIRSGTLQEIPGQLTDAGSLFVFSVYNFCFYILSICNLAIKISPLTALMYKTGVSPQNLRIPLSLNVGPLSLAALLRQSIVRGRLGCCLWAS